jgi:hypothetical protein
LVGESEATRRIGLTTADFGDQEYLLNVTDDAIVLMGKDWVPRADNQYEAAQSTGYWNFHELADFRYEINYAGAIESDEAPQQLTLPGTYDAQATCYAVYDFLERYCGVRFYGPTPINTVVPERETLTIPVGSLRRSPDMEHRDFSGGGGRILATMTGNPTPDQIKLYERRLRRGGEKWAGNHSFMSFQDRFKKKNPAKPELFVEERPDFFAKGQQGGPGSLQYCYTNPDLIEQVAKDARDFFDGKGLQGLNPAMGDYFAVVPLDNGNWCKCERCQAVLAQDVDNKNEEHFNSGTATHYFMGFVNAVAKEVRKTHPDKFISTLAYHVYAFAPTEFELEPNVAVAPCLQPRNYWAPRIKEHEIAFYKDWVKQDRPIYLWNYYCFPSEPADIGKWNCFPGFNAHNLAEQIKMYQADNVRGIFLCGIGEQLSLYYSSRLYDDASLDIDEMLDEFFELYFGDAAKPMQAFYTLIEETFSNPAHYSREVRETDRQFHQTEQMAWEGLGTEERMEQLDAHMNRAKALASTEPYRTRVAQWDEGVWQYMLEGRRKYFANKEQGAK